MFAVKEVQRRSGLSVSAIAAVLFPYHNNAYMALRYVAEGKRELNPEEEQKLKTLCGEWPLTPPEEWNAETSEPGLFYYGKYFARLTGNSLTVYDDKGTFIINGANVEPHITITQFFKYINQIITNYESTI